MRIIAAVAVALVACWCLAMVVGPKVGSVAFHMPFLGWGMTWTVCAFIFVGLLVYSKVKG